MQSKNRYYNRSRIAEKKFRQIIRYFALDFSASDTARLTGISVRSVNNIFIKIRIRLAEECEKQALFVGQIEKDSPYCGPEDTIQEHDPRTGCKSIIFGLIKQNDWLYTEIISDARKHILRRAIRGKVCFDNVIRTTGCRKYHGLVDMSASKHYRVEYRNNIFTKQKPHFNGVESFWAYAKLRLSKMKGIRKEMFYFHLKETEFRFNYRRDNVYLLVLKLLREKPI